MAKRRFKKKRNFKKRTFKKSSYTKNHAKANDELVIYMAPRQLPFPPRYRCKMVTAVYGYITTGAGSQSARYFLTFNSVFAPLSGGGFPNITPPDTVEPTGFTQICNANFYRNFRVYGSKIMLELMPGNLLDTVECTITPSNTSSVPATVGTANGELYTRSGFFSSSKNNANSKGGSEIVNYMTVHKFFGVTKRAIEDDLSGNFIGTYNADPVTKLYWVVNYATPNGAGLTNQIDLRLRLTQYVEFFNNTSANMQES